MRKFHIALLCIALATVGLQIPAVSAGSLACKSYQKWNRDDAALQRVQLNRMCQEYFVEAPPSSLVSKQYLRQLLSGSRPSFDPDDAFSLHTNAAADAIIYLDFDGHTWEENSWWIGAYGIDVGETSAGYTLDGDATTFTEIERNAIYEIWSNVAEEFSMYDVDVTTERPTGAREITFQARGSHALILSESSVQEGCGCGGVAYVNVFAGGNTWNYPALNFSKFGSYFAPPADTAEIISHEVGHNLGLAHDGTTTGIEYYGGHAMWTPIMGAGRGRGIATWSYGGYPSADTRWNQIAGDDDYAQIDYYLDYYADDHGNSFGSATTLDDTALQQVTSGVISTQDDIDFFRFNVSLANAGLWNIELLPAEFAPNLDPELKIYNEFGVLLSTSNPLVPTPSNYYTNLTEGLDAHIELELSEGTYFISIDGVGQGSLSLGTGYDDYASRGSYALRFGSPSSGAFIRDVTPTSAGRGKAVSIIGSNLDAVTGLRIGETQISTFWHISNEEIVFGLPANVSSGSLVAETSGDEIIALENFTTLSQAALPTISSLSSQSGVIDQIITIIGDNVGATITVTLAGQAIPFTVTGTNSLQFQVDSSMSSGKLTLITAGGNVSARRSFTVLLPMTISTITPQNISIGGNLTILGANFTRDVSVNFTGGAKASRPRITAGQITLKVPTGALSGPIMLTNSIGSVISVDSINIVVPPPTISRFSPTSARVGNVVTITGNNFIDVQSVKLGSISASFTVVSATTIRFTVPVGARTSVISVTTQSGTANSRGQLRIR
ncbi:MAG: IPT/TIG domain-containing protein [Candidatus Nanopelagicales bacterium]